MSFGTGVPRGLRTPLQVGVPEAIFNYPSTMDGSSWNPNRYLVNRVSGKPLQNQYKV